MINHFYENLILYRVLPSSDKSAFEKLIYPNIIEDKEGKYRTILEVGK